MRNRSVRLIACGALVSAGSLAVALPGGMASAKVVKASCTAETGNGTTETLSGCTDSADTGGGGTATSVQVTGTTSVSGTETIHWTSGKTTVITFTGALKGGKADKCTPPAGHANVYEVKSKGTVTGGTASALQGGKFSATVCAYNGSGLLVVNFPGKPIKL